MKQHTKCTIFSLAAATIAGVGAFAISHQNESSHTNSEVTDTVPRKGRFVQADVATNLLGACHLTSMFIEEGKSRYADYASFSGFPYNMFRGPYGIFNYQRADLVSGDLISAQIRGTQVIYEGKVQAPGTELQQEVVELAGNFRRKCLGYVNWKEELERMPVYSSTSDTHKVVVERPSRFPNESLGILVRPNGSLQKQPLKLGLE